MCTFLLKYHIIKWNNNEIRNDKLFYSLYFLFSKIKTKKKENSVFQHKILFNNNFIAETSTFYEHKRVSEKWVRIGEIVVIATKSLEEIENKLKIF